MNQDVTNICRRLLKMQVAFDLKTYQLTAIGVELPNEMDIDLVDVVADIVGVPADCRDWVTDVWYQVLTDEIGIETFLLRLRANV